MVRKNNNPGIVVNLDKSFNNKKIVVFLMDKYTFVSAILSSLNVELYEFIKKIEYGAADSLLQGIYISSLKEKQRELKRSFTSIFKLINKHRGDL